MHRHSGSPLFGVSANFLMAASGALPNENLPGPHRVSCIVASVGRRLRKRPVVASALATAIAALAVLVIAWVTGADAVGRAFNDFHPEWIALIAGAELLAY